MPRLKRPTYQRVSADLRRHCLPRADQGIQYKRFCTGNDGRCTAPPVPDAPVALCGKHLREVYEYAHDLVTQRWDGAVREFVAELLPRFTPPPSVKRRPRPGTVYFIRLGDRIKVGYSENLDRRLAHEEILGFVPGTRADEQAWHQLLAPHRVTGEWYRAELDVLDQVKAVLTRAS